jgi:hypothetical protein
MGCDRLRLCPPTWPLPSSERRCSSDRRPSGMAAHSCSSDCPFPVVLCRTCRCKHRRLVRPPAAICMSALHTEELLGHDQHLGTTPGENMPNLLVRLQNRKFCPSPRWQMIHQTLVIMRDATGPQIHPNADASKHLM